MDRNGYKLLLQDTIQTRVKKDPNLAYLDSDSDEQVQGSNSKKKSQKKGKKKHRDDSSSQSLDSSEDSNEFDQFGQKRYNLNQSNDKLLLFD